MLSRNKSYLKWEYFLKEALPAEILNFDMFKRLCRNDVV